MKIHGEKNPCKMPNAKPACHREALVVTVGQQRAKPQVPPSGGENGHILRKVSPGQLEAWCVRGGDFLGAKAQPPQVSDHTAKGGTVWKGCCRKWSQ